MVAGLPDWPNAGYTVPARGEKDRVIAALKQLGKAKSVDAAMAVSGVLRRGGSPEVLEEALKAAGKLKEEASSTSIAPYLRHRNDSIRREAAKAIVKTKGKAAVDALRLALRSGDAVVRGTAASGLGALGAKEALDDLFTAFDHRVAEAAGSIGQVCDKDKCADFASRLGKMQFDVMTSGFDQILFRPADQIGDDEKIRVIGQLRELGTAEVSKYLADVSERWPAGWSARVKQAIDAGTKATKGSQ